MLRILTVFIGNALAYNHGFAVCSCTETPVCTVMTAIFFTDSTTNAVTKCRICQYLAAGNRYIASRSGVFT